MCHDTHVKISGQLVRVSSLLPLCGSRGLDSYCQAWQQVPLPAGHPALTLSSSEILTEDSDIA